MELLWGDEVEIIEGFYKGCKGIVEDKLPIITNTVVYNVKIQKLCRQIWKIKDVEIVENYLRRI